MEVTGPQIFVAVLAVACCAAFPLVGGAVGGLTASAFLGIAGGLAVSIILLLGVVEALGRRQPRGAP